jgi:hypothetical protein
MISIARHKVSSKSNKKVMSLQKIRIQRLWKRAIKKSLARKLATRIPVRVTMRRTKRMLLRKSKGLVSIQLNQGASPLNQTRNKRWLRQKIHLRAKASLMTKSLNHLLMLWAKRAVLVAIHMIR